MRIAQYGIIAAGLLLAVVLGALLGSSEYPRLIAIAATIGLIVYVAVFRKFTWQIVLLICFTTLNYAPLGFTIATVDLVFGFTVLLFAVSAWNKPAVRVRPALLEHSSFNVMNLTIGIWIIYVLCHFALNFYAPYRPTEFSFNNLIKTYVRTTGPLLALFWFVKRPDAIWVPRNYLKQIAWLLLLGLSLNVVIRGVGMMLGIQYTGVHLAEDEAATYFTVPVINAAENVYALRGLCPFAVLFSFALLTARGKNAVPAQRLILWLIFVAALVGSLLSGGRATVVMCAGMVITTLLLRKRFALLAAAVAMTLIFLGVANLFAAQINRAAPLAVQRTLQWVLVEKSPEASMSIQSSSNWRYELFRRSIAEWKSDPRILWFGRATYVFNTQDLIARQMGAYEAGMESSLRRGFTHNLLTDQLVVFGLIGFILYSCVVVSVSFFLLGVWRDPGATPDIKNLALIALIMNTVSFVIGLVGGGIFSPILAWLIILLIARIHQVSTLEVSRPTFPKLEEAAVRQIVAR